MEEPRPPLDPAALVGRLGQVATEAAQVAVGLGILGVNRLQALRRQVAAERARRADPSGPRPHPDASGDPT